MLKIIAVITNLFLAATSALASGSRPGPENPCLDGYQWYPDKRICARKLEPEAPAEKVKCKVGSTRTREEVRDGRRVTITQTCGFVR